MIWLGPVERRARRRGAGAFCFAPGGAGMREMDLVMGQFADAALPGMSEAELDEFERLLDVPDPAGAGLDHRRGADAGRPSTRRCSRGCGRRRARLWRGKRAHVK